MGQPRDISAFRKRLKNAGYFDIHITADDGGFWIVSACEPLGGYRITVRSKGFGHFLRHKLGGGYVYYPHPREFTDQQVNQHQEFTDQQVNQHQEFTDQQVNQH